MTPEKVFFQYYRLFINRYTLTATAEDRSRASWRASQYEKMAPIDRFSCKDRMVWVLHVGRKVGYATR